MHGLIATGKREQEIASTGVVCSLSKAFHKDQYEVPAGATTFADQQVSEALRNIS